MTATDPCTQLVEANIPLAHHVARRHVGLGYDRDEALSAAYFGLLRAARAYDPARGVPFGNFAARGMAMQIRNDRRDTGHVVQVSAHVQELMVRAAKGATLTPDQAADVRAAEAALRGGSGDPSWVAADEPDEGRERAALEAAEQVDRLLTRLLPAQREVVAESFGLGGRCPRLAEEIARERGVAGQAVRQQLQRAMKQLRRAAGAA